MNYTETNKSEQQRVDNYTTSQKKGCVQSGPPTASEHTVVLGLESSGYAHT